jgi:hypothetical protein
MGKRLSTSVFKIAYANSVWLQGIVSNVWHSCVGVLVYVSSICKWHGVCGMENQFWSYDFNLHVELYFDIIYNMEILKLFWYCLYSYCCNPNLGLATKAKSYKGSGQKWSPRVTFHAFRSVGKCEGMNPHTPKWAPTLGIGLPMNSQWTPKFSKGDCRGQNSLD